MRWVCPRCGSAVSVALEECPRCAAETRPAEAPARAPIVPPAPGPPATAPPPSKGETGAAASRPEPKRQAPAAVSERAYTPPQEEEESFFWRGFRTGVGFMLAVVTILLLLVLFLLWLRGHPEWRERWDLLGFLLGDGMLRAGAFLGPPRKLDSGRSRVFGYAYFASGKR